MLDKELRLQLLRAATKDRAFLRVSWRDIDPDLFADREEQVVAKAAIQFYENYEEPIGGMLRASVDELVIKERFGAEGKKKLRDLLADVYRPDPNPVPVKALQDRLKRLKRSTFYDGAVNDIITAYEGHKLDSDLLSSIVEKAQSALNFNGHTAKDYTAQLENRIGRRQLKAKRCPLLFIDPLDTRIKAIARGEFGMILAPPNAGKGLALLHISVAYAKQKLKVLHFSLEDPPEEVEDRLDSIISGIPINKLALLPKRLKRRFNELKVDIEGRLRLVDATDGEWTVAMIERVFDEEKRKGFEADAIIIDYDEELKCSEKFSGDNKRRYEFIEIYKQIRKLARNLNVILWTAAQTNRAGDEKRVIQRRDVGEDWSKIKRSFIALGLGSDQKTEHLKCINVLRHRTDRSRFVVDIMSNFPQALFYDKEATIQHMKNKASEAD